MKRLALLMLLVIPPLACKATSPNHSTMTQDDQKNAMADVKKAVAVLHGTNGNEDVHGVVWFTQKEGYIEVKAEVKGLAPGKHGFHIHEWGDCSSGDGKSAGGHFNPEGVHHAGPEEKPRHVGDLGNLEANDQGVATLSLEDKILSFSGPHSIIGRGMIVHADADDLTSQPTGNAGGRVACGVIGIAKPD